MGLNHLPSKWNIQVIEIRWYLESVEGLSLETCLHEMTALKTISCPLNSLSLDLDHHRKQRPLIDYFAPNPWHMWRCRQVEREQDSNRKKMYPTPRLHFLSFSESIPFFSAARQSWLNVRQDYYRSSWRKRPSGIRNLLATRIWYGNHEDLIQAHSESWQKIKWYWQSYV